MVISNVSVPRPPEDLKMPAGSGFSAILQGAAAGETTGSVIPGWRTAAGAVVGGVAGYFGNKKAESDMLRKDWLQKRKYAEQTSQFNREGEGAIAASTAGTGYFTNMYSAKNGGVVPSYFWGAAIGAVSSFLGSSGGQSAVSGIGSLFKKKSKEGEDGKENQDAPIDKVPSVSAGNIAGAIGGISGAANSIMNTASEQQPVANNSQQGSLTLDDVSLDKISKIVQQYMQPKQFKVGGNINRYQSGDAIASRSNQYGNRTFITPTPYEDTDFLNFFNSETGGDTYNSNDLSAHQAKFNYHTQSKVDALKNKFPEKFAELNRLLESASTVEDRLRIATDFGLRNRGFLIDFSTTDENDIAAQNSMSILENKYGDRSGTGSNPGAFGARALALIRAVKFNRSDYLDKNRPTPETLKTSADYELVYDGEAGRVKKILTKLSDGPARSEWNNSYGEWLRNNVARTTSQEKGGVINSKSVKIGGKELTNNLSPETLVLVLKLGNDIKKSKEEDTGKKKDTCKCGCKLDEGGKCGCGCKVHAEEGGELPEKFQDGGSLGYDSWLSNLPDNLKSTDTTKYDMRGAYDAGLTPVLNKGDGRYHLGSRDPKTGRILKSREHETFQVALDEDAKLGYLPYVDSDNKVHTFKEGEIPEGFKPYTKQADHEKFRDGGRMNIIPTGVLHARKNSLGDKGIPVVSKGKDGEMVKVAEIEKDEIIFSLDVTEELEKYAKKLEDETITDDDLIEVGKFVQQEVKNNTVDMTKTMIQ